MRGLQQIASWLFACRLVVPDFGHIRVDKRRLKMTTIKLAAISCLGMSFLPLSAYGDVWDQKTIFTFNAPVEVPGRVLLPGSYVFKLLNTQADRHIVQVFDKDQTHLIGTFLTIPDYRMKPADKT